MSHDVCVCLPAHICVYMYLFHLFVVGAGLLLQILLGRTFD